MCVFVKARRKEAILHVMCARLSSVFTKRSFTRPGWWAGNSIRWSLSSVQTDPAFSLFFLGVALADASANSIIYLFLNRARHTMILPWLWALLLDVTMRIISSHLLAVARLPLTQPISNSKSSPFSVVTSQIGVVAGNVCSPGIGSDVGRVWYSRVVGAKTLDSKTAMCTSYTSQWSIRIERRPIITNELMMET